MKNLDSFDFFCSGCGLCSNICPTNAIAIEMNNEGFYHYVIENSKCIECKKCIKKCPVLNYKNNNDIKPLECYAAYNRNDSVLKQSSSGCVFTALAEKIISNNGLVAGVIIDDKIKHIIVDNFEDLEKLRGSKYLQSYTGGIYNEVVKKLKENKKVLFTGTPCQCAAMRNMIEDENLYVVDIVCHGVPSYKVFDKANNDRYNDKFIGIKRVKDKSWLNRKNEYYKEKGKVSHEEEYKKDTFIMGFHNKHYLNDICYNCIFANGIHTSDITIGDFWGVDRSNPKLYLKNKDKGVSIVVINTKKGQKFFDSIKGKLIFSFADYNIACKNNPRINDGIYSEEIRKRKKEFDVNIDFTNPIFSSSNAKEPSCFRKFLSKIKTLILAIIKNK